MAPVVEKSSGENARNQGLRATAKPTRRKGAWRQTRRPFRAAGDEWAWSRTRTRRRRRMPFKRACSHAFPGIHLILELSRYGDECGPTPRVRGGAKLPTTGRGNDLSPRTNFTRTNPALLVWQGDFTRNHCNFAYSALACFRMGMSGSASFHSVSKF